MNTIPAQVAAYLARSSPDALEIFSGEDFQDYLVTERLEEISEELRMALEVEADDLCDSSKVEELKKVRKFIGELIAERKELRAMQ